MLNGGGSRLLYLRKIWSGRSTYKVCSTIFFLPSEELSSPLVFTICLRTSRPENTEEPFHFHKVVGRWTKVSTKKKYTQTDYELKERLCLVLVILFNGTGSEYTVSWFESSLVWPEWMLGVLSRRCEKAVAGFPDEIRIFVERATISDESVWMDKRGDDRTASASIVVVQW